MITVETQALLEKSLLRISDLLRCTAAVAYESGENRTGADRDLAFSAVHLLDVIKDEVNLSLSYVEPRLPASTQT
ncbi:hypothetical protein M2401_004775 [Pseudomonas sp. JUb42]|uniref:DUF3077 domain-containing protein n=1 Tax=Pseudomonas sp. JUb42 TaxID=2940611 RepID=UPI00216763EE|nr:DUF3077 domain-containing protein [Pseudomonas sp. JUb42]MCS3471014.1 hypothetical protein [Pseudomonas sp. JUb42]